MAKTQFTPQADGFHFINSFENRIKLPVIGTIKTYGRCGGMSYTALDHYFAREAMPALATQDFAETNGVPPDGHPLANYIYRRQIKSFMTLSAAKFVVWSISSDAGNWLNKGLIRLTKENEFKKLKGILDRGIPAPLGLIMARKLADFGKNHQVIAYDYDEDAESQTVYIYDVNYAGHGMILRSRRDEAGWQECDTKGNPLGIEWRGWFVQDYKQREIPEALRAVEMGAAAASAIRSAAPAPTPTAPLISPAGSPTGTPAPTREQEVSRIVALQVTLNRVTFNNESDEDAETDVALNFDIGGTSWRWPASHLTTVVDGQSYPLNKRFDVRVSPGGLLTIRARLTPESVEVAPEAGETGNSTINDRHTDQQAWGIGEHVSRSAGEGIVYTVAYTVAAADQA